MLRFLVIDELRISNIARFAGFDETICRGLEKRGRGGQCSLFFVSDVGYPTTLQKVIKTAIKKTCQKAI